MHEKYRLAFVLLQIRTEGSLGHSRSVAERGSFKLRSAPDPSSSSEHVWSITVWPESYASFPALLGDIRHMRSGKRPSPVRGCWTTPPQRHAHSRHQHRFPFASCLQIPCYVAQSQAQIRGKKSSWFT